MGALADHWRNAAQVIHGLGARYVVVTGGHAEGSEATDIMIAEGRQFLITSWCGGKQFSQALRSS